MVSNFGLINLHSIKLLSVKCPFGNSDLDILEFLKLQSSNLDLKNSVWVKLKLLNLQAIK